MTSSHAPAPRPCRDLNRAASLSDCACIIIYTDKKTDRPVLQDQINSLVTSSNHASDIGLTLQHYLKDISKLSDLLPNTKKLQRRLTAEFV